MNAPLSAGAIGIAIHLAGDTVCAVELRSQRPQALSRLFDGRAPDEAARLAGQLFSLCGFSQATAARLAVARAEGRSLDDGARRAAACGLLAERIFETLRALTLQWPGKLPQGLQAAAGTRLREALAASRALVAAAQAGQADRATISAPAKALAEACDAVGVSPDNGGPVAGSLLHAIARDLERDEVFTPRAVEALCANDDPDVATLLGGAEAYASRPFLPGRIVETGAYARQSAAHSTACGPPRRAKVLSERLAARERDLQTASANLLALAAGQDIDLAGLMNDGHAGASGYGVVECARGRLYHAASLDGEGRLGQYRILAPTEWNFHPAGPFVETLLSSRIGRGDVARQRAAKLAALFDPCVAFDIVVEEPGHA